MRTLLACSLALLLPVAHAADGDEPLDVLVVLPTFGQAVFGEVAVGADIYPPSADVERVEFYLDGQLVGEVEEPPWIYVVDAGEENVEHRFRVVVYEASGKRAESEVATPKIETDEEIDLDLQQLYITVENPGGERVLDLQRSDFAVFDNGVRQQIVTYERGDVPFTAVILVDASTSMRGRRLRLALQGAEAFVAGLEELDEAKLILFSDRAIHETPFTSFASVLTVGLAGVTAGGGTALNDHLYLALKRLEPRKGRKVVVILSDGIDVESFLSMDRVRWMASQEQPVIYWIRLNERSEDTSAQRWSGWRDPAGHKEELELLRRTVSESGGRIEAIQEIEEVGGAFQRILEELRNQYVIGYYPSEKTRGERWHKVRVRVRDAALDVRTRGGYLEPGRWRQDGGGSPAASD